LKASIGEKYKLEVEFFKTVAETKKEFEAKTKEINKLIRETVKLSETSGIPLCGYAAVSQQYFPGSFDNKWGDVSEVLLEELEIYPNEYSGWEHSAFC